MSETFIGILGALTALGLLVGIAYVLDRKRKAQNKESNKRDRRVFYASVGLFLGGVLLIAGGAFYGSNTVAIIGIITWFSALGLRWVWAILKLS